MSVVRWAMVGIIAALGGIVMRAEAPQLGDILTTMWWDGQFDIVIMRADGSNPRVITGGATNDTHPVWSRGGAWIAYESDANGNSDIFVMAPDGTQWRNVTNSPQDEFDPSWSPDGQRLVYASGTALLIDDGHPTTLRSIAVDGSDERVLVDNSAFNHSPAWSPDGERILFVSNLAGNDQIFIMNADGTGVRRLTTNNRFTHASPAWSPDGALIAFSAFHDGNVDIYVMDANGGNVRRVTNDPARDIQPFFTFDGERILFASNRNDVFEIFSVLPDGTGLVQITSNVGPEFQPNCLWRP